MSLAALSRDLTRRLEAAPRYRICGRVQRASGLLLEATGVNQAVGGSCLLEFQDRQVPAEVVGFSGQRSFLMPLAPLHGIAPGARVLPEVESCLPDAAQLLGRVVDALGQPLDGLPAPAATRTRAPRLPINPLDRRPIIEPLDVGVRSINGLLSVGVGQRVGIFAGSGVGKSVLLGMLARFTSADAVVVGLIGERGREVQEFVADNLADGLGRSIVVAAPADASPALRLRGANLAMELAESLRADGKRVLLLMDSLTRVAQAQREIGLSMGEPPTAKGYTPSAFAVLPQLVERAGQLSGAGSITAFFTVLMEEDDLQDPIVDASRAVLDGHFVLSRRLADRGHYPALDIEASISRLMHKLVDDQQAHAALRFRALWSRFADQEDLINVGAYQAGSDPDTDEAIRLKSRFDRYLMQVPETSCSIASAKQALHELLQPETNLVAGGDAHAS